MAYKFGGIKQLKGIDPTLGGGSSLGLSSPASKPKQYFNNILVVGGAIDGTPIGSFVPSTGAFTDLTSGNANGTANKPPSLTTFYGTFPTGGTPQYFQWNPATNTANIQGSLKVSNNDTQLGNVTVGNSTIGTTDNTTLKFKSPIPTFQAKDNETDASCDHGLQFTIANGNQAYYGYAAKYNGFAALTNATIVNDVVQGGTPAPITCAYINTSITNPDGTVSPGSTLTNNSLTFPNSPAVISSPDVLNLSSNHILIGSGQSSGSPARLCFIHNPQTAAPGYDCRSYISLDPNSTNLDFVNESGQLNLHPGGTTPTVSLSPNSQISFESINGNNSPSISQTSAGNLQLTSPQVQLENNASIQFGTQNSISSTNAALSLQSPTVSVPNGSLSVGTNGLITNTNGNLTLQSPTVSVPNGNLAVGTNGLITNTNGNNLTLQSSQGDVILDGSMGVHLKDNTDKLYFGTDTQAPSISRDSTSGLNLNSNTVSIPQNSKLNLGPIQLNNTDNSNLAVSSTGNVNWNIGGKFYINGVEIPQHFNADGSVSSSANCPPQKELSVVSGRQWDNIKQIGPQNSTQTYIQYTTPNEISVGQKVTVFGTQTSPSSDVEEATVAQVLSPTEIVINTPSKLNSITQVSDGQITLPMTTAASKAEGDKIYWYGKNDTVESTGFFGLDPQTEKFTFLTRNGLDADGNVNASGELGGAVFADGSFKNLMPGRLVQSGVNGQLQNIEFSDVAAQTVTYDTVHQAGALMRQGGITNAMTGNLFYSYERLIWDLTTTGCQLNANVQISYFSVTNVTNINKQTSLSVAIPNGSADGQTKIIVVTTMPKFMEVLLTGSLNCPATIAASNTNCSTSNLPPNITAIAGPCCCKENSIAAVPQILKLKLRHQRASVHLIWDNVLAAWMNINSGGIYTCT